ncbi:ATP-binding cassette domain-containing protein [Roseateles sp. BYS180W]|uniref:ATP-binding cassette domain-containing protein n=1 Tax=Roseateles rivi TaxID=3299028 RepID=A0ABW7FRV3_9BURK
MSAAPLPLQAQGLCKSYRRGKPALQEVSLQLERGERVVLLGPNGAGKSTLLQLLTGLFVPDAGSIHIEGHDLRRHPHRALAHLGVVFQQPALDLDLSVRANLRFHTDLHGMPRREAEPRIDAALQRLGLEGEHGKACRALSGGTRRKVELARALLHSPSVLLMDEATVGLDPASRAQLLQSVSTLQSEGVAVLWATHLVEEVAGAQRLLVLHQGRIRHQGSVAELLHATGEADAQAAFLALTKG